MQRFAWSSNVRFHSFLTACKRTENANQKQKFYIKARKKKRHPPLQYMYIPLCIVSLEERPNEKYQSGKNPVSS